MDSNNNIISGKKRISLILQFIALALDATEEKSSRNEFIGKVLQYGKAIELNKEEVENLLNIKLGNIIKSEIAFETPESVWASIVDGLEKKEDRTNYPDSIFWFKDDKLYFECSQRKYLWCHYENVWLVFEQKLRCSNGDVKSALEGLAGKHFKLKRVAANVIHNHWVSVAESHFSKKTKKRKSKIITS